ncbi:hypothetical protein [Cereibacter azotoformans]|uniref:hypothetical protein n=1 Tax=Cereibacter azotoformans TaxID=43057 RepID=UPI001179C1C3|nr:hypothetical protein [Cereibacter azotoformans]
MALASLKARIERLQAKQNVAAKVLGVSVDGTPMWREVMRDGVLHCLPRYEHDEWAERCRHQQAELQEQLRGFAALLGEEDTPDAPAIVGNDRLAPLPAGKKRPRFFEAHGREIDAFSLTRN